MITEEMAIEIPKTETFLKAPKEISDFLDTLDLTAEEHSLLVIRLAEYTQEIRKDAFSLGFIEKYKSENDLN